MPHAIMARPTMSARLFLLLLFVVAHTNACTADADKDPTGPCDPVEGNLLADPSFELLGGGSPGAWSDTYLTTLTPITDDPVHCTHAVEMVADTYGSIGQDVSTPGLSEGMTVTVVGWMKYISGPPTNPSVGFEFLENSAYDEFVLLSGFVADGAWHEVKATFPVPAGLGDVPTVRFAINNVDTEQQVLHLDHFAFLIGP